LGDGGQGVVYLGENAAGHRFAIKWLRADLAGDPVGRERFLREVAAAQRVAAFCTAQIVETGVEQERPYIVSEYIEGPSLQRLVSTSGPRTGPSLERLAVGTATALAAIHQAGIAHRDFKPANVLMAPDGPRVIDFGIAKALDSATYTSQAVGTPSYMSPEQLSGQPVGAPADMFAWACTMVYAATGEPPFGNDSIPAVIHRILTVTPDLNRLHGNLRELVAACLEKDPARRPTAEQVLMRLLQQDAPGPAVLRHAAAVAAQPGPEASQADVTRAARPAAPPPPAGATGGHTLPPSPAPGVAPPAEPHGPYRIAEPPTIASAHRSPGRRLAVAGTAAAVALALLAGVLLSLNGQSGTAAVGNTSAAAPAATPTASPTPTAGTPAADAPVPTEGLTETKLPGAQATAYEHPDDKISLVSYLVDEDDKDWNYIYLRTSPTGEFIRTEKYWSVTISPDFKREAGRTKKLTAGHRTVDVVDRQTGEIRSVKTVRKPLIPEWPEWSRDSSRVLYTVRRIESAGRKTVGFLIIDAATGAVHFKRFDDEVIENGRFYWTPEGTGVVVTVTREKEDVDKKQGVKEYGLRFYNLDGKVTREITGIGEPYRTSPGPFSPSGRQFATKCPDGDPGDCVWDTTTGERIATVSSSCYKILGWYDESHLFCWAHAEDGGVRVVVVNLRGDQVRLLLSFTRENNHFGPSYRHRETG